MKTIKKDITFFYTDNIEKETAMPIAKEAEKRGYKVTFTDNIFEKAEIGLYCQHLNYPKNSKISIIMLHDLGQQHTHWPNIWENEMWNIFDIGFLPNMEWVNMWKESSKYSFACPKKGAYYIGWPKADAINSQDFISFCNELKNTYNLDPNKKTVLYAPSWEWDNRQLEMIDAVKNLGVNLIIKQAPWNKDLYPEQYAIVEDMKQKSLGLPNVYCFDSNLSIFNAIQMCDVLVSEESSTMYEAMMMNKPVIAVTDWKIPDSNPPREPYFPYDFAVKTEKKDLCKIVSEVLSNNKYLQQIENYRNSNFPNIGNAAKTAMDIIDSVVFNIETGVSEIEQLPKVKITKEYKVLQNKRKKLLKTNELLKNTIPNSIILSKLYSIYKVLKKLLWQNQ